MIAVLLSECGCTTQDMATAIRLEHSPCSELSMQSGEEIRFQIYVRHQRSRLNCQQRPPRGHTLTDSGIRR